MSSQSTNLPWLPKISVIIPCFDEEMWVGAALSQLLTCPSASEIIAVDDGSKDKTLQILKIFADKIKIISFTKNQGKGAAMAAGVKKAKGEIVVFADAHHLNIKDSHIKAMTDPLVKGKIDAVLGTTVTHAPDIFWRFTGFRAYRRIDLLPILSKIKKTRFGVEAYLNELFKEKRVKVLWISDLVHLVKHQKMPIPAVPNAYLNQAIEMAQTLAKIKGVDPKKIGKILNPKKIKSIKILKEKIKMIKNKEFLTLLKKYILSYLPS